MRHLRFGFECASCGTVRLDIPRDADEQTVIRCCECHAILGRWGKIQDLFLVDLGNGEFDLNDGRISRVSRWPAPETKLEMAFRHVKEGAVRVARQRELVKELQWGGHATDNAQRLLITFEQLQHMHEAHLEALLRAADT